MHARRCVVVHSRLGNRCVGRRDEDHPPLPGFNYEEEKGQVFEVLNFLFILVKTSCGSILLIINDRWLVEINNKIAILQDADKSEIKVKICVHLFDLLYFNGESLVKEPFRKRRETLKKNFMVKKFDFYYFFMNV